MQVRDKNQGIRSHYVARMLLTESFSTRRPVRPSGSHWEVDDERSLEQVLGRQYYGHPYHDLHFCAVVAQVAEPPITLHHQWHVDSRRS